MVTLTIDTAVDMNNEAVLLLARGQEQSALAALQSVVTLLKRTMMRSRVNSSIDDSGVNRAFTSDVIAPVDLPELSNVQSFIYNRALAIDKAALPDDLVGAAQICSAVVLFNTALTLHRGCFLQNKMKGATRSIALYKLALKMLPGNFEYGTVGVLRLASLNNLSQLCFEAGDFSNARNGFENLAKIMSVMGGVGHMRPCDARGLWMNVLQLKDPKCAPAA